MGTGAMASAILIEGQWPDWGAVFAVFLVSLLILWLAARHFHASSYRFLEEI